MGGNIYGVEAASRVYFGIPSSDLNLAQASILAALPNDPTDLNPYIYWERLKKRQLYVLNRNLLRFLLIAIWFPAYISTYKKANVSSCKKCEGS